MVAAGWRPYPGCGFGLVDERVLRDPAEAGQAFQIVAMPVDDAENERLMNWIIQTKMSGEFPPIALPAPMAGCTGRILTVRRM